MTRKFIFSAILLAGTFTAFSQASFSPVTINKVSQPGLMLQLNNDTDMAEGTLLKKLKETGYSPETTGSLFWKKNTVDGFYVFNGVSLPEMNNQKLDLYFKIERQGKKRDERSTMWMLVSKGYDNFVSPNIDSATFKAATAFLNSFTAGNVSYGLQQEIQAQEKVVLNAERKLEKLEDDYKSIEKKIEQLQSDLIKKNADKEGQINEIQQQKSILEALRAKVIPV